MSAHDPQDEESGDPPVGPLVEIAPALLPDRVVLEGRYVKLVPLDPEAHGEALWSGSSGPANNHLWPYLFDGPFTNRVDFDADLARKAASTDPFFFGILDRASGQAAGRAAYLRIEPTHRVIEVGNILFLPAFQRTRGATEAMYLMARYVFESLGFRRYEWKCNALNAPSRRAALRLGFRFEGIFNQHMIVKGRSRDTAWFAMLDYEWPSRKVDFERWLDPSNFDERGIQKTRLASL